MEADDEDTQDGDSLSHLKLDVSLTELHIDCNKDPSPESPTADSLALERAKMELEELSLQLEEARREISLLKAERDFLREQNQTLRNKK